MEFKELREQIDAMPAGQRKDYRKIFSFCGAGGRVWPQLAAHLEAASTVREFLDAVYEDDACRYETVWALWAKLGRKPWVKRFEPQQVLRDVKLKDNGLLLECADGASQVLIPLNTRGKYIDICVFAEDGFNSEAAELFSSITGRFMCCGILLEGTFDVYRADHAVIFEQWNFDQFGRRSSSKSRCSVKNG